MAKKLTARAVENAAHGPKRKEVPDGYYTGLYLVLAALPSDTKTWAYRYRINGKTAKLTLGRYPKISLASAHKLAAEAELKLRLGKNPAKAEADTFGDYADKFFKGRKEKAGDAELRRAVTFDCGDWWDLPLASITHGVVKRRLDEVQARSKTGSSSSTRKLYAGLMGIFQLGLEHEVLSENPIKNLSRPPSIDERERVLDDDELVRIWNAAVALGYPFGTIIRLLVLSGARRDEIGDARAEWLNLDKGTLTIPKASMKTRLASHTIYLTDLMRSVLAEVVQSPSGFLFGNGRGFRSWSGYKRQLDKLSGVSDWRVHDLRRTAKTGWQKLRWRDANGNICRIPFDIRQLMSAHAVAGVVGIYERDNLPDECRAGFEAWSARVQSIVTPNVVQFPQAAS